MGDVIIITTSPDQQNLYFIRVPYRLLTSAGIYNYTYPKAASVPALAHECLRTAPKPTGHQIQSNLTLIIQICPVFSW